MLETEVRWTMWNSDDNEVEKMMTALKDNSKFLFSGHERRRYGFPEQFIDRYSTIPSWNEENVSIQKTEKIGKYIAFHFKLETFKYPKRLHDMLRELHWKIKGKSRSNWIRGEYDTNFKGALVGEWTECRDDDFPEYGGHGDSDIVMSYDNDDHWYTDDWVDDANLDHVPTPPRSPREKSSLPEKCSKFAQYLSTWFKMPVAKHIEASLNVKRMSDIRTISIGQIHKLDFLTEIDQARLAEILTSYDDFDRIDTPEHSPRQTKHMNVKKYETRKKEDLAVLLCQLKGR